MVTLLIRKGDQELEVTLTPKCYLCKEALVARKYLEKNSTEDHRITIEHDLLNRYDKHALIVCKEGLPIGYIQKRFPSVNRTLEIETFFFKKHLFIDPEKILIVRGGR